MLWLAILRPLASANQNQLNFGTEFSGILGSEEVDVFAMTLDASQVTDHLYLLSEGTKDNWVLNATLRVSLTGEGVNKSTTCKAWVKMQCRIEMPVAKGVINLRAELRCPQTCSYMLYFQQFRSEPKAVDQRFSLFYEYAWFNIYEYSLDVFRDPYPEFFEFLVEYSPLKGDVVKELSFYAEFGQPYSSDQVDGFYQSRPMFQSSNILRVPKADLIKHKGKKLFITLLFTQLSVSAQPRAVYKQGKELLRNAAINDIYSIQLLEGEDTLLSLEAPPSKCIITFAVYDGDLKVIRGKQTVFDTQQQHEKSFSVLVAKGSKTQLRLQPMSPVVTAKYSVASSEIGFPLQSGVDNVISEPVENFTFELVPLKHSADLTFRLRFQFKELSFKGVAVKVCDQTYKTCTALDPIDQREESGLAVLTYRTESEPCSGKCRFLICPELMALPFTVKASGGREFINLPIGNGNNQIGFEKEDFYFSAKSQSPCLFQLTSFNGVARIGTAPSKLALYAIEAKEMGEVVAESVNGECFCKVTTLSYAHIYVRVRKQHTTGAVRLNCSVPVVQMVGPGKKEQTYEIMLDGERDLQIRPLAEVLKIQLFDSEGELILPLFGDYYYFHEGVRKRIAVKVTVKDPKHIASFQAHCYGHEALAACSRGVLGKLTTVHREGQGEICYSFTLDSRKKYEFSMESNPEGRPEYQFIQTQTLLPFRLEGSLLDPSSGQQCSIQNYCQVALQLLFTQSHTSKFVLRESAQAALIEGVEMQLNVLRSKRQVYQLKRVYKGANIVMVKVTALDGSLKFSVKFDQGVVQADRIIQSGATQTLAIRYGAEDQLLYLLMACNCTVKLSVSENEVLLPQERVVVRPDELLVLRYSHVKKEGYKTVVQFKPSTKISCLYFPPKLQFQLSCENRVQLVESGDYMFELKSQSNSSASVKVFISEESENVSIVPLTLSYKRFASLLSKQTFFYFTFTENFNLYARITISAGYKSNLELTHWIVEGDRVGQAVQQFGSVQPLELWQHSFQFELLDLSLKGKTLLTRMKNLGNSTVELKYSLRRQHLSLQQIDQQPTHEVLAVLQQIKYESFQLKQAMLVLQVLRGRVGVKLASLQSTLECTNCQQEYGRGRHILQVLLKNDNSWMGQKLTVAVTALEEAQYLISTGFQNYYYANSGYPTLLNLQADEQKCLALRGQLKNSLQLSIANERGDLQTRISCLVGCNQSSSVLGNEKEMSEIGVKLYELNPGNYTVQLCFKSSDNSKLHVITLSKDVNILPADKPTLWQLNNDILYFEVPAPSQNKTEVVEFLQCEGAISISHGYSYEMVASNQVADDLDFTRRSTGHIVFSVSNDTYNSHFFKVNALGGNIHWKDFVFLAKRSLYSGKVGNPYSKFVVSDPTAILRYHGHKKFELAPGKIKFAESFAVERALIHFYITKSKSSMKALQNCRIGLQIANYTHQLKVDQGLPALQPFQFEMPRFPALSLKNNFYFTIQLEMIVEGHSVYHNYNHKEFSMNFDWQDISLWLLDLTLLLLGGLSLLFLLFIGGRKTVRWWRDRGQEERLRLASSTAMSTGEIQLN